MYVYTCTHMNIHMYIYTQTHIHIHTDLCRRLCDHVSRLVAFLVSVTALEEEEEEEEEGEEEGRRRKVY